MIKQHFFIRLIPPRPTFAQDITEQERALIAQHTAYVRGFFDSGAVLANGPALEPEGSFGAAQY